MKNKTVLLNAFSLLVLQGTNYLLPLITLPYLVRVLGQEKMGLIIFVTAFTQYFVMLCDFGFNYTATREISINREDKNKVSEIFSKVLSIKLVLLGIAFCCMLLIVRIIPGYNNEMLVFIAGFTTVLGNALFPLWFYQGIENMKIVTILNIFSKVVTTIGIFVWVNSENDYILAVFLQSLAFLITGIVGFIVAIKKFKISFKFKFSFRVFIVELKENWKVFMSTFSINIYNQGSIIILGLLTSKSIVGYYGIAQKIVQAVIGISQPFAQAIYPHLCRVYNLNKNKYKFEVKRLKVISILCSLILGIFTFCYSDFLTWLVTGELNEKITVLVSFWSVVLVFIINNIVFNTFILSMGKYKEMQKMYGIISIVFLIIAPPLTYYFKEIGMSWSLLVVEGYIFIKSVLITKLDFKNENVEEKNVN
ncbi:oligosaccharide flippase family protein [Bacillus pacificus]|nr:MULTISPECIES: oligosaccharide flippase family protein [Bacillus cereus group]ASI80515.1 hypothetical protein BA202_25850 [Bacillus cereus]MCC2484137.1 oligosaccharide flippase family protein [Bacillus pacificus]MDA1608859.1 oligosaccharide flippase family protein [Bacillus cereus group sp. TH208-1LC]MDA2140087.1 oligosaccharide flippase family protein [Bacillus cereus group sp. Bc256]MED1648980.1 oligosaccharide flippase family protein [Bacillus pacificus]